MGRLLTVRTPELQQRWAEDLSSAYQIYLIRPDTNTAILITLLYRCRIGTMVHQECVLKFAHSASPHRHHTVYAGMSGHDAVSHQLPRHAPQALSDAGVATARLCGSPTPWLTLLNLEPYRATSNSGLQRAPVMAGPSVRKVLRRHASSPLRKRRAQKLARARVRIVRTMDAWHGAYRAELLIRTGPRPSHPGADGVRGARQDVLEHIQVQRHPARRGDTLCRAWTLTPRRFRAYGHPARRRPPGPCVVARLRFARAPRAARAPGCPIPARAASLARRTGGALSLWFPEPARAGRARLIRRRRKRSRGAGLRGVARAGPRSVGAARCRVVRRRAALGRARLRAARRGTLAVRARATGGVGGAAACEQQQAHDAAEAQRPLPVLARRPRRPLQRQPADEQALPGRVCTHNDTTTCVRKCDMRLRLGLSWT